MRSQPKKFVIILLASFWLCFSPQLIDFLALPASASIYQQAIVGENGGSTSNFEDETGNIWELIVWQEANNEDSDIYLRLVGYPLFQIDRERPLEFSDATHSLQSKQSSYGTLARSAVRRKAQGNAHQDSDRHKVLLEAKDLYPKKTPAFHVAKYSIKDILPQLPTNEIVDLSFYLTSDRHVHLKIPPEVIAKWRSSNNTESKSDLVPHKKPFLLA